jgi:hypothetical protein
MEDIFGMLPRVFLQRFPFERQPKRPRQKQRGVSVKKQRPRNLNPPMDPYSARGRTHLVMEVSVKKVPVPSRGSMGGSAGLFGFGILNSELLDAMR